MSASRQNRERLTLAWLIAMSVSHLVIVYETLPFLHRGYQDFTIFYTAGRLLRSNPPSALYDLDLQRDLQRQFAPAVKIRSGPLPYNHPPFEALLFVPLAALSYWPAYLTWTAVNLVLLVTSLFLLRKKFELIRRLSLGTLLVVTLGFFPVVIAVLQGQDAVLLLSLCVLAIVHYAGGNEVSAGAFLGLGLFKPQLVLPIVVLLAIRRPRLLLGFFAIASLLTIVTITMLGWDGPLAYARFVWNLEKSGAGAGIGTYEMPNLRGLISYLPLFTPDAFPTLLVTILSSLAIVAGAVIRIRKPHESEFQSVALATCAALLVSYHSFIYDWSLLLPVAFWLLAQFRSSEAGKSEARRGLALLALFLTPLYVLFGFRLSRLCWMAPVLLILFWVLYRSNDAGPQEA